MILGLPYQKVQNAEIVYTVYVGVGGVQYVDIHKNRVTGKLGENLTIPEFDEMLGEEKSHVELSPIEYAEKAYPLGVENYEIDTQGEVHEKVNERMDFKMRDRRGPNGEVKKA